MPRADVKSLNATVMALKEGVETLAGQRGTGDWRALTPQDDISLSGTSLGIDAVVATGNITAVIDGQTLVLNVPAGGGGVLEVSGTAVSGAVLDFKAVQHFEFEGNAFLDTAHESINILGIINTAPRPTDTISNLKEGGAWVYIEFNAPTGSVPPWVSPGSPLENISDCRLYFSSINSTFSNPVTLTSGGESDCVAQVVTTPATLISNFAGAIASGLAAATIAIPVTTGRVVMAIIDQNVTIPITISSPVAFDTSIVSTMSSGTEPTPTGVLLSADIDFTGELLVTVSSSSSFSAAAYLGVLLGAPVNELATEVTVTVPPLELISGSSIVSSNLWELHAGTNVSVTGSGHLGTISAYSSLLSSGTLVDGSMLGLNITGPGATVTSSGGVGNIFIPGGGGGGGGGGGISFQGLGLLSASETVLIYPVGSAGLILTAGLPGWSGYAVTAPTINPVVITLYKNGTSIGTINWAVAATAPTLTFTSTVTFVNGDVLTGSAQTPANATFADFGVVLVPVAGGGALGSYANETSGRSFNIVYTNTSGSTMKVTGWGYSGSSGFTILVNGVQISYSDVTSNLAPSWNIDVPSGQTYEIASTGSGAYVAGWFEALW